MEERAREGWTHIQFPGREKRKGGGEREENKSSHSFPDNGNKREWGEDTRIYILLAISRQGETRRKKKEGKQTHFPKIIRGRKKTKGKELTFFF